MKFPKNLGQPADYKIKIQCDVSFPDIQTTCIMTRGTIDFEIHCRPQQLSFLRQMGNTPTTLKIVNGNPIVEIYNLQKDKQIKILPDCILLDQRIIKKPDSDDGIMEDGIEALPGSLLGVDRAFYNSDGQLYGTKRFSVGKNVLALVHRNFSADHIVEQQTIKGVICTQFAFTANEFIFTTLGSQESFYLLIVNQGGAIFNNGPNSLHYQGRYFNANIRLEKEGAFSVTFGQTATEVSSELEAWDVEVKRAVTHWQDQRGKLQPVLIYAMSSPEGILPANLALTC